MVVLTPLGGTQMIIREGGRNMHLPTKSWFLNKVGEARRGEEDSEVVG